jgi:pimeloyl-ACP methyl ester carboxylesterase
MKRPVDSWLVFFGFAAILTTANSAATSLLPDRDTPVPASQQIPVIDFFRPFLCGDPILNPAGTYFAACSKSMELQNHIFVGDLATGKIEWANSFDYEFDFHWINDRYLELSITSLTTHSRVTGSDIFKVGSLAGRAVELREALPDSKRGVQPNSGYFWLAESPKTPQGDLLRYWALPENGEPGFCETGDEAGLSLYRFEKKRWVKCPVDADEITPIGPSDRPGEMLVLGACVKGTPRSIQKLDTVSGKLGEIVYQDAHYDCEPRISIKRGTWEINGVFVADSACRPVWLSEKMKHVQSLINHQFAGMLAKIVSSDLSESRFVIEVESDRQPPIYYLLDYEKKSLGLLKNAAPWIDPQRMRSTQLTAFKVRDGAVIEGYLTLPEGASKEHPAPLVTVIARNPWQDRRYWGWNGATQFLASRGYAVFEVNFRGSPGYESRSEKPDRFDFRKMHQDVTDGVRALIKSGLVDPDRIALYGTGFGSYLALCAEIENPELYRCAVVIGGVFDWNKALRKARTEGDPVVNEPFPWRFKSLEEKPISVLERAEQIGIPVFIARNVKFADLNYESQAGDLASALRREVPHVIFGDRNNYAEMEVYSDMVDRNTKIEEFLNHFMAPK